MCTIIATFLKLISNVVLGNPIGNPIFEHRGGKVSISMFSKTFSTIETMFRWFRKGMVPFVDTK